MMVQNSIEPSELYINTVTIINSGFVFGAKMAENEARLVGMPQAPIRGTKFGTKSRHHFM